MPRGPGEIQQKILTLLLAGFALSLSSSPSQSVRIIRKIGKEWERIEKRALAKAIKRLYQSQLVNTKENKDGSLTLVLTDEGHQKALTYNLDDAKIKIPRKWDKKWRLVLFDVPENKRNIRDILRFRLKKMGLYEFQKSAFICPYNCCNEINFLVELYNAKRFVRFVVADLIDNELDIRHKFNL